MWAKKWLLGRDRFTYLNLLNFFRNDSPEDCKNYLRMSDENAQYLIAKVNPLIAKQDTVMRNAITPEAASRAPPKALMSQARIGQVRLVTLHTRTSLTHWNPSLAGLASQNRTCMGTLMGQSLLIIDASWSHSDTPHSVGILWTSNQPVAESSTWNHTRLTRERHPCPQRD
jgi:hypothetical protein